jgi:DNA mismatch repair protein MutL
VLPDVLANQIAAGEVIERPASVVKELVENALDAGARRIVVELEEGGTRLIRVTDDGHGISAEDAPLAFLRHATSKIHDQEDLWRIGTLGFRGEALPSIAAVATVELTTRTHDAATGVQVRAETGRVIDVREAGLAAGTMVTVRDLFAPVPARRKFLKSLQTELGHVVELLTRVSLGRPACTFACCIRAARWPSTRRSRRWPSARVRSSAPIGARRTGVRRRAPRHRDRRLRVLTASVVRERPLRLPIRERARGPRPGPAARRQRGLCEPDPARTLARGDRQAHGGER